MDDLTYWINTKDYTTSQLMWNGIGCMFWVITYAVLLRDIIRKKFVEMPFLIASGNLAWEFIWSFFYHPDTGELFSLSYQGAFVIDIFIFYFVLRYGYKQINVPEIQKHFKLLMIGLLVMWVLLNYFFVHQNLDTPIGANSGYILNLIISLLYPVLLFRNDPKNFSQTVAWCKLLGTGCISVSMFLIYTQNYFVQTLAVSCFIFDLLYAFILNRKLTQIRA
ncbi:MAG: hypothetical protein K0R26_2902 [Bacteroidota bacterium]|jgi:hypothetical protein|nr:hypothetical protein [Bacteroidota bacterium]